MLVANTAWVLEPARAALNRVSTQATRGLRTARIALAIGVVSGSSACQPPQDCASLGDCSIRTDAAGEAEVSTPRQPEAGAAEAQAPSFPPCSDVDAAPWQLATDQYRPGIMTLNAQGLYWVDFLQVGAMLMRAPLDGGSPVALVTGLGSPRGIAADADYVYFTDPDSETVSRVAAGGGPSTLLATGQYDVVGVAVDTAAVYWTNAGMGVGSVLKASLDGGVPVTLAQWQGAPGPLVVDAENAYWSNLTGEIMKVSLDGGSPTALALGQSPTAIAVARANVYWANNPGPVGSLATVAITGGPVSTLSSGLVAPARIAVDDRSVYVTSDRPYYVAALPIAGGPPVFLAAPGCGGDDPFGLTVDARNVYWSNTATGTIFSTPKN